MDVDKLLETFLNCEGKLPYEEYFYDFSDLFSWLSIKIDLINDDGTFNRYWSDLRSPIKQLWITFAKGLRVVKKDDFYNGNTKIWDLEFKESLKSLKFKVINSVNTDNIFPREEDVYDELDKKILDATIGSYLRN
ncbi:MAG: hypothetical protein LBR24_02740 [Methanobrevibacter sp.]|nr:hypothetical protein [Methanobrevibacter sp.]